MRRFALSFRRRHVSELLFGHRIDHALGRTFQFAFLLLAPFGGKGGTSSHLLRLRFCRHICSPEYRRYRSGTAGAARCSERSSKAPTHLALKQSARDPLNVRHSLRTRSLIRRIKCASDNLGSAVDAHLWRANEITGAKAASAAFLAAGSLSFRFTKAAPASRGRHGTVAGFQRNIRFSAMFGM